MRKTSLALLLVPLLLLGCGSEEMDTMVQHPQIQLSKLDIKLSVTPAEGQSLRSAFAVTLTDLKSLIEKRFARNY